MKTSFASIGLLACCYAVALPHQTLANPTVPQPTYAPATTTVAILPVENVSKGKDDGMRAKQTEQGMQAVTAAFAQRGFRLVDAATVAKSLQDSHLDLSSSASWTPENLAAVGSRSGANIVALLVITDTHQGFRHGFLVMGAQREGEAKTKLWLVDTQTQAAVVDGVAAAGKAQTSALSGWVLGGMGEGSSAYVLKAIDDAVNKSLTGFFKPYPVMGKTTMPLPPVPVATAPKPPVVAPAVTPAALAPAPAAPTQSLFTFANGAQAIGTLLSFDGSFYTVSTTKGMRQFKKAAIVSIRPLAPATVAGK